MKNKKTVAISAFLLAVCVGAGIYIASLNRDFHTDAEHTGKSEQVNKKDTVQTKKQLTKGVEKSYNKENDEKVNQKQGNLYSSTPTSALPLSAIPQIANLPENIQQTVNNIIEKSGIYMMKQTNDKILLITENPANIRQGIDFVEISIPSGHQTVTTLGYNGKIKDSENDIWVYNDNKLPVKHTKYSKEGDVEFTEIWNYESDNPIKYEMKNSEGKTVSMRKENLDDGTEMRVEHLIYDDNGVTKINVTTSFEGADIKRFTYYNADKPSEGESIFVEYDDGFKSKETIYNSELKVVNIYEAEYKNGERSCVKIYDNQNQKIDSITQAE